MIKLDRIKILTQAKYITSLNPDLANSATRPNTINQKHPFNLFIQLRPVRNEAIIEFSAKILLDDYPNLISIDTIHQCFENINEMGFCTLDIESVINDSKMLSCDITTDIDEITLPDDFKILLIANLKNVSNFAIQKYGNSGYTISNQLKTPQLKIRLSIYNKYKELHKATNKGFLQMLSNPEKLMNNFIGKYRIETNVRNFKQIKEYCCTKDNRLLDVLNSDTNPLMAIFDKIFAQEAEKHDLMVTNNSTLFDFESINQLRDALLLKECGNDLKVVKEVLNNYYSKKTNKRKYIKEYKKLLNAQPQLSQSKYIMGQIRKKLIA